MSQDILSKSHIATRHVLVVGVSSKKPKAPSFQIRSG